MSDQEPQSGELTVPQAIRARCIDLAIAYAERVFELGDKSRRTDEEIVERARVFEAFIVGSDQ